MARKKPKKPYLGKHPRPPLPRKVAVINAKYLWSNNGPTFEQGGNLTISDIKTLSNNPMWEAIRMAGGDAGSFYLRHYYWKVTQSDVVSWTWRQLKSAAPGAGTYVWNISGNFPMAMIDKVDVSVDPGMVLARSLAKIAFLKKVDAVVKQFAGGVFFGELRETIRMIRRPLSGIRSVTKRYFSRATKLYSSAKKRKSLRWRKPHEDESFVNALSGAYLEWTYGMEPLLNDMKSIAEAVGSIAMDSQSDTRVMVTIKTPNIVANGRTFQGGQGSAAPVMCHLQSTKSGSVRIVGSVRGDTRSSYTGNLERLGLNLSQFVPTIWELIPFSMIADYVTNIGDVLGALFTSTQHLRYSWQTERTTVEHTALCVPIPCYPRCVEYPFGYGVAGLKGFSVKRDKPVLTVEFSDLHLQDPTVKQQVNTAVLGLHLYRNLKDLR